MSEEKESNQVMKPSKRDNFLKRKIHPEQALCKIGDAYNLWKMIKEKGIKLKD